MLAWWPIECFNINSKFFWCIDDITATLRVVCANNPLHACTCTRRSKILIQGSLTAMPAVIGHEGLAQLDRSVNKQVMRCCMGVRYRLNIVQSSGCIWGGESIWSAACALSSNREFSATHHTILTKGNTWWEDHVVWMPPSRVHLHMQMICIRHACRILLNLTIRPSQCMVSLSNLNRPQSCHHCYS